MMLCWVVVMSGRLSGDERSSLINDDVMSDDCYSC